MILLKVTLAYPTESTKINSRITMDKTTTKVNKIDDG